MGLLGMPANRLRPCGSLAASESATRPRQRLAVEVEKTENRNGGLFMLAGLRSSRTGASAGPQTGSRPSTGPGSPARPSAWSCSNLGHFGPAFGQGLAKLPVSVAVLLYRLAIDRRRLMSVLRISFLRCSIRLRRLVKALTPQCRPSHRRTELRNEPRIHRLSGTLPQGVYLA
jgi:hypothetical protein